MKKKMSAKTEVILWTSCMAFGVTILFAELCVANTRAQRIDESTVTAQEWHDILAGMSLPQDFDSADGWARNGAARPASAGERADPAITTDLLVDAILQIESSGNARMVGGKGERGLMQVKKETWGEVTRHVFGSRIPFDRAFDPTLNRRIGTAYLAKLHDFLARHRQNWRADERSLLLACYNAGPSRVKAAGFSLNKLPSSTQDYIKRASALHDFYLESRIAESSVQLAARLMSHSNDS